MRPRPEIDILSEPFWRATESGRLELTYCRACQRFIHPPRACCPSCGSETSWQEVSGRGAVWAVTIPRREWLPGFDRPAPYGLFIVELEEQPGLLMLSDCDLDTALQLDVGQPVAVQFEEHDGFTLPQFRAIAEVSAVSV
jgi:uncharacterized protein